MIVSGGKEKERYEEIEKELDEYKLVRDQYSITTWCDCSGYDYWIIKSEEENYIQIQISFTNEIVNTSIVEQLAEDIEDTLAHWKSYQSFNPENFSR